MFVLIEDYVFVGDGYMVVLIVKDGFVDWLCWFCFDLGVCFVVLFGMFEYGCWLFVLVVDVVIMYMICCYCGDMLIFEIDYESVDGVVIVIDFMLFGNGWFELVWIVVGCYGMMKMCMEFVLCFDYGFLILWVM